jgi:hypothetical protein
MAGEIVIAGSRMQDPGTFEIGELRAYDGKTIKDKDIIPLLLGDQSLGSLLIGAGLIRKLFFENKKSYLIIHQDDDICLPQGFDLDEES